MMIDRADMGKSCNLGGEGLCEVPGDPPWQAGGGGGGDADLQVCNKQ